MAFDYKKEYKEFYMPKNKPGKQARNYRDSENELYRSPGKRQSQ